jgi:sulfur-oxidizing protein SoxB
MSIKGKPVVANKTYKVAGWAPVAEGATGEPIWDVVASYLRDKKVIKGLKLNEPKIIGIGTQNPGIAGYQGGVS